MAVCMPACLRGNSSNRQTDRATEQALILLTGEKTEATEILVDVVCFV